MSEQRERHLVSHVFNVAILLVGCGALAWMVHRTGLDSMRTVLLGVRGWFPLILALDLAAMLCDAAAIHSFMKPEARMVSFWRVLGAQASGRAVNVFVPGGAVGEATKVSMLVDHAPRGRVVSSIVLFGLGHLYLSVVILVIGVPLTSLLVELPHRVQVAVWVGIAVLLAVAVALGVVVYRGTLATILDTAGAIHLLSPDRRARWKAKLVDIDRHLRDINPGRASGARRGLALLVASRLLGWSATTVVLHAVSVPVTATLLIGSFSVGVLITWISSIVPLGAGVADGSNYALYGILGAPSSSGLLVTMLNRVRSLTIAALGLLAMAIVHTLNRITLARRNARLAALVADASAGRPDTP